MRTVVWRIAFCYDLLRLNLRRLDLFLYNMLLTRGLHSMQ